MSSNLDLGGQARVLIDDVEILGRTPSVTVRAGAVWALGYWRVGRRDCHPDPVIALGPTWVTATGWDTVEDWVEAQLSSRWGAAEGADFDQEGLCAEVREVINDNLPAGWTLEENQFVGPTPVPEDALNIVRNTIEEIDFWGMAQYYDNGD